ncbi:MAG: NADH-quinone oxidoreductase subunit NuoH [Chloroflexota bacterium]
MTETATSRQPYSFLDVFIYLVAAGVGILFIVMPWAGLYPGVSYLNDITPPGDLSFAGSLMWLIPVSIIGVLAFTLWGAADVYATPVTSRLTAVAAGIGLFWYIVFFVQNGIQTAVSSMGFWGFWLLFFSLLLLALQAIVPRSVGPRPAGERPPRVAFLPLQIFLPIFVVGNAALFLALGNWGAVLNAGGSVLEFLFDRDTRTTTEVILCSESNGCRFLHPIIYTALLLAVVITGFAYTTLLERKFIAWFQQRVGPNRVGPGGFLQPAADGLKLIFKENILPEKADKPVYRLAPMLKAIPTLVVLAVIPLGPDIVIPWFDGNWYQVPLGLADPGVGILWLLAITSIGTYGVVLAGWASNNKYSMLGGMRAASQMVSYELSMGITLAVPVLIAGTLSIGAIVEAQGGFFINWFVFQNPLAAIILMIALIAETNRAPFDLPEAEQELTAGYMTEYSGMKFALFMMAEYLGMIAVSLIAASTFFGGYNDGFGLVDSIPILGPLVLIGKVVLLLIGFVWLRATLPRIRYDRLMMFGWKIMLPLALLSVVWTAVAVIVGEELGTTAYVIVSGLMFVLILAGSVFFLGRPEREEEDETLETDPVITGESRGFAHNATMVLASLIAVPFGIYNVTAPLVVFGWRLVTVPMLALFNVGDNRAKLRRGVLVVVEPIANMGSKDEEATDAPRLGGGD